MTPAGAPMRTRPSSARASAPAPPAGAWSMRSRSRTAARRRRRPGRRPASRRRRVGTASIYRALELLVRLGLVRRLESATAPRATRRRTPAASTTTTSSATAAARSPSSRTPSWKQAIDRAAAAPRLRRRRARRRPTRRVPRLRRRLAPPRAGRHPPDTARSTRLRPCPRDTTARCRPRRPRDRHGRDGAHWPAAAAPPAAPWRPGPPASRPPAGCRAPACPRRPRPPRCSISSATSTVRGRAPIAPRRRAIEADGEQPVVQHRERREHRPRDGGRDDEVAPAAPRGRRRTAAS